MEMKAVTEYEAPNYDTYEEKKNKIFRFVMNMPKVSIGVLSLFLISSNSYGIHTSNMNMVAGGLQSAVRPFEKLSSALILTSFVTFSISFIIAIIGDIKLKNMGKNEIRKLKKKRYIMLCCTFLIISVLLLIIAFRLFGIVEWV